MQLKTTAQNQKLKKTTTKWVLSNVSTKKTKQENFQHNLYATDEI